MSKSIKFDSSQNPAKNFGMIVRNLEEISQDTGRPVTDIIDMFIVDLQNYYNEEYEKKVDITLKSVTPKMRSSFLSYLNKMKKEYQKKERSEKRKEERDTKRKENEAKEKEMQGKWKEVEKSLSGNITDLDAFEKMISDIENSNFNEEEKEFMKVKLDEKRAKFIETWSRIEDIVEQSSETGNKTKLECWQAVKDLIAQRNKSLKINMNEEMEKQMISMIDEKISGEKDVLYYEQVKYFTRDFSFLREYPELQTAMTGSKARKFTDKESFNRFYDLRSLLQNGYNESIQIERLLRRKDIGDADKRILTERKAVINKELEDKAQPESR